MNKKQLVDAHVHMFPADIVTNWDWYAQQDSWFATLTRESPNSRVREAFATAEEALQVADEAGLDILVMQGWYWRKHELCVRHNNYMHELITKYPQRYKAFASINPTFGEAAVQEVERCHKLGFSGIGELGPGGNEYSLDHPGLLLVLEAAQALQMPVNFHVGEPVGHVYAGKDLTPIEGFYRLAKQFPNLTMILSHMGGGLPFFEIREDVRSVFSNVYYDIAATPLLYDIHSVRALVQLVGEKKILFGSDFPLTIYPRLCKGQNFSIFIENIRSHAMLNPLQWDAIMGENMLRLLR